MLHIGFKMVFLQKMLKIIFTHLGESGIYPNHAKRIIIDQLGHFAISCQNNLRI